GRSRAGLLAAEIDRHADMEIVAGHEIEALLLVDAEAEMQVPVERDRGIEVGRDAERRDAEIEGDVRRDGEMAAQIHAELNEVLRWVLREAGDLHVGLVI